MIQANTKSYRHVLALVLSAAVAFGGMTIPAAAAAVPEGTSSDAIIMGFEQLPEEIALQTASIGTPQEDLVLPETLTVTEQVDAGQTRVATLSSLVWTSGPAYDPETEDTYIFTPTLPEGYALADGVSLPEISVTVGAAAPAKLMMGLMGTSQIEYVDENGVLQAPVTAALIEGSTTALTSGWHYATGTLALNGTITISGDVKIILTDGCDLTVTNTNNYDDAGINVAEGNGLTIYAQSAGTGVLKASGGNNTGAGAGIGGGRNQTSGTIILNGVTVNATGHDGAGIGGGDNRDNGNITINKSTVTAVSRNGSGIGGGAGSITINSSIITATSSYGLGIGSRYRSGGSITINGSTVTANGDTITNDIGYASGGSATINGGSINSVNGRVQSPQNSNGQNLVLAKVENVPDIELVQVDGSTWTVPTNHPDILQNYAKATGYRLPVTREAVTFTDVSSIGSAYKTAVTAMQQAGVMIGEQDNKFNPKADATRAEVSAMLHRYVMLTIDPSTAQGWAKNDDGQLLYYQNGAALTGWQDIGADGSGKRYCFDEDGVAVSGK
ncbi:MAG TPA: S-layer homology domain-containing protein [Negativicutes bacterium]|nr:S-layer homology domain-containing protein [Negativicutes bacterium]